MESLLKPVMLSPETDRVLGGIRTGAKNALYGAESVESEKLFHKHVASLVEGAGLPVLQEMHYRWFLRELARLWRTRQGRDLAFHLELCIRKWVGLGLEPRTLQFLVCESYERLKGTDLTTKTQRHEENPDHSATKARNHEEVQPEPENPRTPEPQCFTTKTQRHQAGTTMNDERGTMNERTKDAKIAKSEPDSPTGTGQSVESAESVDDSPAPGSAPSADVRGPDPEPASTTKTPRHEENQESEHSIPRSLDPSISSELP